MYWALGYWEQNSTKTGSECFSDSVHSATTRFKRSNQNVSSVVVAHPPTFCSPLIGCNSVWNYSHQKEVQEVFPNSTFVRSFGFYYTIMDIYGGYSSWWPSGDFGSGNQVNLIPLGPAAAAYWSVATDLGYPPNYANMIGKMCNTSDLDLIVVVRPSWLSQFDVQVSSVLNFTTLHMVAAGPN